MGVVATTDGGELPRAPHEGIYVAPSGHRAWFPKGAPLLGGYIPESAGEATAVDPAGAAENKQARPRETAAQRRKRETD